MVQIEYATRAATIGRARVLSITLLAIGMVATAGHFALLACKPHVLAQDQPFVWTLCAVNILPYLLFGAATWFLQRHAHRATHIVCIASSAIMAIAGVFPVVVWDNAGGDEAMIWLIWPVGHFALGVILGIVCLVSRLLRPRSA